MEDYLKTLEAEFNLSKLKISKELISNFRKELKIGLSRSDGMLKALPTFVYNLPKGSEVGKYLTVQYEGTVYNIPLSTAITNNAMMDRIGVVKA